MIDPVKYYTTDELAERWSCSVTMVRDLIYYKRLSAVRLGTKILRIPEDAVLKFEKENTV